MARSKYIYVVTNIYLLTVVGTFTTKYEMRNWMQSLDANTRSAYAVRRHRDAKPEIESKEIEWDK
jgi:hypothetical protein